MRIDLDREQASIAAQVIRSAAALERDRSRRLWEDSLDGYWFSLALWEMFKHDNKAMRRLTAGILPVRTLN